MNRDDAKVFLVAGLIAVALVLGAAGAVGAAEATGLRQTPSAAFCWLARRAVSLAGGEKAAESRARADGVSEETIANAKRCPRDPRALQGLSTFTSENGNAS